VNTSATSSDALGSGRKRVLFVLKTNGDFIHERRKVGRPVRLWRLTDKGYDRFPDRHAEFVIAMLQAVTTSSVRMASSVWLRR
jgi:predicted ArsR family transcriptional regulator